MKMSSNVTANLRSICQSMASVVEQNKNTLEVLGTLLLAIQFFGHSQVSILACLHNSPVLANSDRHSGRV